MKLDMTWNWTRKTRPKTFASALNRLLGLSNFTLSERALAIYSGCGRLLIRDFIEGREIPNDKDIKDIAGAFTLNLFGRVNCTARDSLFIELRSIARNERAAKEETENEK